MRVVYPETEEQNKRERGQIIKPTCAVRSAYKTCDPNATQRVGRQHCLGALLRATVRAIHMRVRCYDIVALG